MSVKQIKQIFGEVTSALTKLMALSQVQAVPTKFEKPQYFGYMAKEATCDDEDIWFSSFGSMYNFS